MVPLDPGGAVTNGTGFCCIVFCKGDFTIFTVWSGVFGVAL